jgi:hypothetical protein
MTMLSSTTKRSGGTPILLLNELLPNSSIVNVSAPNFLKFVVGASAPKFMINAFYLVQRILLLNELLPNSSIVNVSAPNFLKFVVGALAPKSIINASYHLASTTNYADKRIVTEFYLKRVSAQVYI